MQARRKLDRALKLLQTTDPLMDLSYANIDLKISSKIQDARCLIAEAAGMLDSRIAHLQETANEAR
jgi:hypothetical protein